MHLKIVLLCLTAFQMTNVSSSEMKLSKIRNTIPHFQLQAENDDSIFEEFLKAKPIFPQFKPPGIHIKLRY